MKKGLSLLASIFLLSSISCTDEVQEMENQQPQATKQIVMTMQDFQLESCGRTAYQIADDAMICTWIAKDTVGIFPEKGAQAYFPMASGAGTKNATFDGEGWALKDGITYGAYFPFIGNMYLDRESVPVSYSDQVQTGDASTSHLGTYDFMASPPVSPQSGSVQFTFKHLSALVQLKLTIPQPATASSVRLVAETEAFSIKGKVNVMANTPSIIPVTSAQEITLHLEEVSTTEENQTVTLYLMIPPADLSQQTLKAVVTTDKGTQEVSLTGKNFQAGKAYALSGELQTENETEITDVEVRITEAGTMRQLLGDDYLNITSLKVIGPINGDDVYYLRKMAGYSDLSEIDRGKLSKLDLSEASIVEGGGWYYEYSEQYYTSNDTIGNYMFYKCAGLQDIVLPANITSIGSKAFSDCSSLTSFNIPDGVDNIDSSTFSSCTSLASVDIPESVTSIGNYAFYGCSSLTTIDIPNNVASIGEGSFLSSGLTSIDIPDSVTKIETEAFSKCKSLISATIGDGVKSIGFEAFSGCSSLTNVIIGDGVTSISGYAFAYCYDLVSLIIGKNVNSIGEHAFYHSTSLINCYCYATNPPSTSSGGWYPAPAFPTYNEQTTLYVPLKYGAQYNTSLWGEYFPNIVEME